MLEKVKACWKISLQRQIHTEGRPPLSCLGVQSSFQTTVFCSQNFKTKDFTPKKVGQCVWRNEEEVCNCQMPLLSCLSASCCLPHEIQFDSSHFSIKGKKFRTYKNRLTEGGIDDIMLLNANERINEDMNRFTRTGQR